MLNNEATLSHAPMATSNIHADQFSVSKAFYDQVRSDFLRQSATYLRLSLGRSRSLSCYSNNADAEN